MRFALRSTIPALLLLGAACNSGENPIIPPSSPSYRGMTVTLLDSVAAPGGYVRAQLENRTGGTIQFGALGCWSPVEQLTSRGWVEIGRLSVACTEEISSLADGGVYPFGLKAPDEPGHYRWKVGVRDQNDSALEVTTEPVAVR